MDPNWRPSSGLVRAAHLADFIADITDSDPADWYWSARFLNEDDEQLLRNVGYSLRRVAHQPVEDIESLRQLLEAAVEERADYLARQTNGKNRIGFGLPVT